ncbi:MAG: hypothetical protein CMLOHMNK_02023 [Steroidobacteraceae bacterium]|nr:hypothetical protein [Steroidobacteraceae bacterium]
MDDRSRAEQEREKIAALYDDYWSEEAIALEMGLAKSAVSYHINIIRERIRKSQENHVAQRLARELHDLDGMEYDTIQRAKAQKKRARLEAEHRLKIKARRARLLGLDKPQGQRESEDDRSGESVD